MKKKSIGRVRCPCGRLVARNKETKFDGMCTYCARSFRSVYELKEELRLAGPIIAKQEQS